MRNTTISTIETLCSTLRSDVYFTACEGEGYLTFRNTDGLDREYNPIPRKYSDPHGLKTLCDWIRSHAVVHDKIARTYTFLDGYRVIIDYTSEDA